MCNEWSVDFLKSCLEENTFTVDENFRELTPEELLVELKNY